ncbi:hypothetical protein ACN42_g1592 [Penicillium freii]|uniref:Cyanovirin-N domain-containing protein n=1 Tax=Penicillium freii TaxID=48697 RepID=A0A117NRF3_PENFR|nr:hypothetical protein ACN42_g1592 [Penicillium freii]
MGFQRSSQVLDLKDKHILTAYCQRPSGESIYSELDLNEFLGANKGQLAWGSHDFLKSSRNVDFRLEGPDNEPILHAQLNDGEGNIQGSQVNLGDCIKNEDAFYHFRRSVSLPIIYNAGRSQTSGIVQQDVDRIIPRRNIMAAAENKPQTKFTSKGNNLSSTICQTQKESPVLVKIPI